MRSNICENNRFFRIAKINTTKNIKIIFFSLFLFRFERKFSKSVLNSCSRRAPASRSLRPICAATIGKCQARPIIFFQKKNIYTKYYNIFSAKVKKKRNKTKQTGCTCATLPVPVNVNTNGPSARGSVPCAIDSPIARTAARAFSSSLYMCVKPTC